MGVAGGVVQGKMGRMTQGMMGQSSFWPRRVSPWWVWQGRERWVRADLLQAEEGKSLVGVAGEWSRRSCQGGEVCCGCGLHSHDWYDVYILSSFICLFI